jgi:hypothetical protein
MCAVLRGGGGWLVAVAGVAGSRSAAVSSVCLPLVTVPVRLPPPACFSAVSLLPSQLRRAPRPPPGLLSASAALVVLAALLTVVLPPGSRLRRALRGRKTRVWASASAAQARIGADRPVSAGQRLRGAASCPFCVSGSCVAPEAADPAGAGAARTLFHYTDQAGQKGSSIAAVEPAAEGTESGRYPVWEWAVLVRHQAGGYDVEPAIPRVPGCSVLGVEVHQLC